MLIHNKNFNIKQIADSGQCFRMNPIGNHRYALVAFGKYLELLQIDENTVELSCDEVEFHEVWEAYFDLDYDYKQIVKRLTSDINDPFLKAAATFGSGIRILRQEPFEAMISFIISQNKNIPAIKNCIELICRQYGERKVSVECGGVEYDTFPSAKSLAMAKKEDLRLLKTGYRDQYIINAAQAVYQGTINLPDLSKCSYEEATGILKTIPGIGEKVANCISLYGLHHIEVFPVDVWIKRVLEEIYKNEFDPENFRGYAGIVQQYMFYYMRHIKSAPKK